MLLARGSASAPLDCSEAREPTILVDTGAHRLALCEAKRVVESYSIRIGSKGVGKRSEGDSKTPLGTYPLDEPRLSAKYGTFIPVGYPTAAQRREGYTGGAVGVHGPDRRIRWAGGWVNAFDTTDGCIGIATDAEMARIAAWVRRARARQILIR